MLINSYKLNIEFLEKYLRWNIHLCHNSMMIIIKLKKAVQLKNVGKNQIYHNMRQLLNFDLPIFQDDSLSTCELFKMKPNP